MVAREGAPLRLAGTLEPGATLLSPARTSWQLPATAVSSFPCGAATRPRCGSHRTPPETCPGALARSGNRGALAPRSSDTRAVQRHSLCGVRGGGLRQGILHLVRAKKVNAVELDLKDEAGEVGWASGVELAKAHALAGLRRLCDLKAALDGLHRLRVRVIRPDRDLPSATGCTPGRPSWKAGRQNEVVREPRRRRPLLGVGGFAELAAPPCSATTSRSPPPRPSSAWTRRYPPGLSQPPDGPLSSMRLPDCGARQNGDQSASCARAGRRLPTRTCSLLRGVVLGVAATRPKEVAQDVPGYGARGRLRPPDAYFPSPRG